MGLPKIFRYDTVLDPEDLCNLDKEYKRIWAGIQRGEKMVVYGRRNSGKTSLITGKIIPEFRKKHKECFVLSVDLMQVKSLESIHERFKIGFERAFSATFPAQKILGTVKSFFSHLQASIEMDPLTQMPILSLKSGSAPHQPIPFSEILKIILSKISKKMPTLIVLDEFQDISLIDESAGLMRSELQHFKNTPILLMGSEPQAPFADFGVDIRFGDIPYEEFHAYIQERLQPSRLTLSLETSIFWQDLLHRNAESINIVGAHLVSRLRQQAIQETDIRSAIEGVISERQTRFQQSLAHLSETQEKVLISFAKHGPVLEPTSKSFLRTVPYTHATVSKAVKLFLQHSILEPSPEGLRLMNPLLKFYLIQYR